MLRIGCFLTDKRSSSCSAWIHDAQEFWKTRIKLAVWNLAMHSCLENNIYTPLILFLLQIPSQFCLGAKFEFSLWISPQAKYQRKLGKHLRTRNNISQEALQGTIGSSFLSGTFGKNPLSPFCQQFIFEDDQTGVLAFGNGAVFTNNYEEVKAQWLIIIAHWLETN